MSPSKSVTESLKIFGIDEGVRDLVAIAFDDDRGDKVGDLQQVVKGGQQSDWSDLEAITKWTKIATLYGMKDHEDPVSIRNCVISKASAKDLIL